jgi:hypothetical protein
MNIEGMQVYFTSDLKDYGYTEDGEKFIGEVFSVFVENQRGDRWVHALRFDGVKKEHWEEGIAYLDDRSKARSMCALMVERIQMAGKIDLRFWSETRCAYGSVAYLDYGMAEEVALERMEG